MKVYNLTDITTSVLTQRGLDNKTIAVARRMVNPGEFIEVVDTLVTRNDLQYLLQVGAVSIDQVPPSYAQARQKAAAQTGHLGSIPVKHVLANETPIAVAPISTAKVPDRKKKGGYR